MVEAIVKLYGLVLEVSYRGLNEFSDTRSNAFFQLFSHSYSFKEVLGKIANGLHKCQTSLYMFVFYLFLHHAFFNRRWFLLVFVDCNLQTLFDLIMTFC